MERLLIGRRAMDVMNEEIICEEFQKEFGIRLNSERYTKGKLEDQWDCLIQDCTISEHKDKLSRCLTLFEGSLFDVIYPDRSKLFTRDPESEEERRRKKEEDFRNLINEYKLLLDNYWFYKGDIWLNVWLVLKYFNRSGENDSLENSRAGANMEGGNVLNDKREEIMLPFEDVEDRTFCSGYLYKAVGKKGCLFWTDLEKDEKIDVQKDGIENSDRLFGRAEIKLKNRKVYNSFSYKKIREFEDEEGINIEDKVLYHKTVNGISLRNVVNKMFGTENIFEIEDYIDLIDQLCGCKSLEWQSLIGCVYVLSEKYKKELVSAGFYGDVMTMLITWLCNIDKINYNLRILTEGFLYLYKKNDHKEASFKSYFEERCREYLSDLELEVSDEAGAYWSRQPDKLNFSESILKNHDYCWIYAILQRRAIDTIKNLYRKNQFQENSSDVICFEDSAGQTLRIRTKRKFVDPDELQADEKSLAAELLKNGNRTKSRFN